VNETWSTQPFDNVISLSHTSMLVACLYLVISLHGPRRTNSRAWQHNWILTEFITILHNMTRAHATTICQVKTRLHSISMSTNGNTSVTVCLVHMLLLKPEYQYQKCTSYCHQKSLLRDRPSARLYRFRKA